ncbi:hypothetical protein DSM104443_03722 [Usitatibacter rugosus]|uniref:PilY1 beta-propeller domain-containing protein n=1 Tax=Usitatibacter rugosus TaxID=2732067 RepID=A0A6M4GZG6_9PROT|nr:PilC/PilY family type IV pilus protein [Usitatibacter rugosus]QJR12631.1 hypothetical protein DSM104443_03722 [Usitatibacter rugosus]
MRIQQTLRRSFIALVTGSLLGTFAGLAPLGANAQVAQLADVPLAQAPSTSVLPNLMYILDDSGSMGYNYMPDQVQLNSAQYAFRHCKVCKAPNKVNTTSPTNRQVTAVDTGSTKERITLSGAHGGTTGTAFRFTAGTPPSPLALNVTYYMRDINGTTAFSVALASGGSAVNLLTNPTGATFTIYDADFTTVSNHGGSVGQTVVFTSGTPPSPLTLNTVYYITLAGSDGKTLQVSATSGGSPIVLTDAGSSATLDVNGGYCQGPGTPAPQNNTGLGNGEGMACGTDQGQDANVHSRSSSPEVAEALFYAPVFNKIWYNPAISYAPAVDSTGTSLGNIDSKNATSDYFMKGAAKNLTTAFNEVVYCNTTTPSTADLLDTTKCRRNGKDNVPSGYFTYYKATAPGNEGYPNSVFFNKEQLTTSNPHYYNIAPVEHCKDENLTECMLTTTPSGDFSKPAPLRWCNTKADATTTAVVSSTSNPKCRKKFEFSTNYIFPRFGRFSRVDIVTSTANYAKVTGAVRPDCVAATTCTYAEEVQNFANWYGYYRIRMALMKTATGRAFLSIDDRYRVGFITINPGDPVSVDKYLKVGQFVADQRKNWYEKLYASSGTSGTPLREALSRVGRYYAGQKDRINSGMRDKSGTDDPVQYTCQANYALLTTDGYWNQATNQPGQQIDGSNIPDKDGTQSAPFITRATGTWDGGSGASGSLADVAAYYYIEDLRPDMTDNVPTQSGKADDNNKQHMVTFGLGLGLEGLMDYIPDYDTRLSGDFYKIKQGASNCSWKTGVCDWPVPVENQPATLDDLWHAAVNGRGAYFSASDPNSLAQGLLSALSKLKVATAAASASATSSPNITESDNYIFSSTFRTGIWDGEIVAQRIDIKTGKVIPGIEWAAQALLDARAADATDSRLIYTIDEGGASKRKDFKYASLKAAAAGAIAAEQPYFASKCGAFGQCVLLTADQQAIANDGTNLVNYLRGQRQHEKIATGESTPSFRKRDHILGDVVNASPVFVGSPFFAYNDAVSPTYEDYKTAQDARTPVLYAAANDGMLHALNANTGQELWSYVPRMVMPNLHKLANANWGATHRFSVDGTPSTADVFVGGAWKTILVAGLSSGGRGFYALDVTNPASPVVLWEICADASLCAIVDTDLGFSYGNAEIGKRKFDGKWVVYITSGLNNITPGTGKGFLYVLDLATGAVLNKVATGEGTVAAPTGFSRISGFVADPQKDRTITTIYGGDLFGNVYRFDTSVNPPVKTVLATLKDKGGKPQSVTTRPELTAIRAGTKASDPVYPVVYVGTGRYLGIDDLKDPAKLVPAQPFAYENSLYAIKDKGLGGTYANFRTANVVENVLTDKGTSRTATNKTVNWAVNDGWFIDLNPNNTTPGERINLDPLLVSGILVVVGNIPNNEQCSIGGDAFAYFFSYNSGGFPDPAGFTTVGQKITGQTIVGYTSITGVRPPAPGDKPGDPPPEIPDLKCRIIFTLATGEKITLPCPQIGGAGVPRRTSWRELIQK